MERSKSNFNILKKIEREREKRGWSEYNLAKNSNIAQSTISTWYRRNMEPSIASVEKICAGFGISLSQFFSDESIESNLTEEQKEIFELWQCLNQKQKNAIMEMLRSFIQE